MMEAFQTIFRHCKADTRSQVAQPAFLEDFAKLLSNEGNQTILTSGYIGLAHWSSKCQVAWPNAIVSLLTNSLKKDKDKILNASMLCFVEVLSGIKKDSPILPQIVKLSPTLINALKSAKLGTENINLCKEKSIDQYWYLINFFFLTKITACYFYPS